MSGRYCSSVTAYMRGDLTKDRFKSACNHCKANRKAKVCFIEERTHKEMLKAGI